MPYSTPTSVRHARLPVAIDLLAGNGFYFVHAGLRNEVRRCKRKVRLALLNTVTPQRVRRRLQVVGGSDVPQSAWIGKRVSFSDTLFSVGEGAVIGDGVQFRGTSRLLIEAGACVEAESRLSTISHITDRKHELAIEIHSPMRMSREGRFETLSAVPGSGRRQ